MKQEQKSLDGYEAVFIFFEIDAKANKFLTEAASKSGRTKRQEAKLRAFWGECLSCKRRGLNV